MKFTAIFAIVIGVLAVLAWQKTHSGEAPTVSVKLPALSAPATQGKVAFDANCASCHGVNAAGTDKGPPFVHDIYNPGHHDDGAFFLAAKQGVRQHHWPYGNMPPQPQVSEEQLAAIVRYVRELQVANGITYRPHRM
ncbi:MAG: cytochrome c [Proteobacteria bacterium]|nr:cytochrome c [Pseudomonadota bacterium]